MGFWSRLGSVIDNYINDFRSDYGREASSRNRNSSTGERRSYTGDPDLDAAYEELDDFLNDKETPNRKNEQDAKQTKRNEKLPPESLRADFECLGVPFGADNETCRNAYKKLQKIHHPDRHIKHPGNHKKATERSAKINAAWDRINKWRTSGSVD
ncbi:MAG: J domain-containing protein [Treponema sp.]|jgi:hypothetical protein|nr:J domain-containing protein [Treponema sp.]